ncbi:oxidoreductase [Corallincola platygyrae]|uniref:Oxidoreductase n=1 Tax=Corallincola platygyrae TaxID=1193278 RepID=A0ABW4XQV5_9GAMM
MNSKTVLITGASSGIGKEAARTLVEQGYTVYAVARRLSHMEDLKQLGCHTLRMDITDEADVRDVVEHITRTHGGVDILINNAGFATSGAAEDISIEDARYQFEVNLFGLGRLTQLVLPYMRERGAGKIINISSVGGKIYGPMHSWYMASKHALEGWSDCLRFEVAQFGVQVVIIEPGAIATEFDDVYVGPMLKRSGKGPYAEMARSIADFSAQMRERRAKAMSHPSVITQQIVKAIEANRPKTRYVAGKLAKQMLWVRKWLGDRFYDAMLQRMLIQ